MNDDRPVEVVQLFDAWHALVRAVMDVKRLGHDVAIEEHSTTIDCWNLAQIVVLEKQPPKPERKSWRSDKMA